MSDKAKEPSEQVSKGKSSQDDKKQKKKKTATSSRHSGTEGANDVGRSNNVATATNARPENDDNVSIASTAGASGAGDAGQMPKHLAFGINQALSLDFTLPSVTQDLEIPSLSPA